MKHETPREIPTRKNTKRAPAPAPAKTDFTPLALGLFMMLVWGMILFLAGVIVAHTITSVSDGAFIVAWTGVATSAIAFILLPITSMDD